ncbi:MBL fold metallo-hydrolase [Phenylobacterium sp.]|jgi:glyoxylase-like metal-dependent hydrolase (beta-lactamase superfamily II)|uniref:MBL fold metallo-hydrolase n=1 Tax=Phenylobacterium sp. TaxID=1871053 RepID=UPI002F92FAC1
MIALLLLAMTADPSQMDRVFARETLQVAPRVHLIHKPAVTDPPFEGNVTVIEQRDGLVLVDAGGAPPSGRAVVAQVRKLSRKPVKWIVYTHYHGDHNLGAGEVLKAWPQAVVVSTAKTRENMTGAPMAYVAGYAKSYGDMADLAATQAADAKLPEALRAGWRRTAAAGPGMIAGYSGMAAVPASRTFTNRFYIADADAPVEVMFLGRGNTDGDAVVWLPKQKVLASGDLVVAPIPYAAHTYPGEWIATLKKLQAIDFQVLIPGHGAPQGDRAYVGKLIAALETVRGQVAPLKDLPLAEVRKRVNLTSVKAGFTGDDPWLGFLIDAVFTGDLISNAWREARGEHVVQGKS